MDRTAIDQERQLITEQIKKYVEQARPFFDLDKTLREYSQSLSDFTIPPIHTERQELLKRCIRKKIETLFGNDACTRFHVNLDGNLIANIVDHHQIPNHPLLIGDNVVGNVGKFLQPTKQEAIVVISSGDVPPNNFFSKNGFHFHGKRVPLFSNSEKDASTNLIPKRDFDFIEKAKAADRWKDFTNEEQTFLTSYAKTIVSLDFSRCADYKDQISLLVQKVWPLMFSESMRPTLPELLYVTQEEITTNCLIELLQTDNPVSACLFDQEFRARVIEKFRGIVVTWNEQTEKGTHFFWRKYPGEPRSLRMYIKGEQLVPADERFRDLAVPLDRDTILDLLRRHEIYPGLFLVFAVLCYYSGMRPLAGYGSMQYLYLMKEAWLATLEGSRFASEMPLVASVQTNSFIAGFPLFFGRTPEGIRTLYTADIAERGGMSAEYLEHIFSMKFRDFLSVAVADMYGYYAQKYIPKEEQIKPTINFDDLASLAFDWV